MERIMRVSKVFHWLFLIILAILPVLQVLLWTMADFNVGASGNGFDIEAGMGDLPPVLGEVTWVIRLAGFAAAMLPTSMGMLVCYHLACLFGLYGRGLIFTGENVRRIRLAAFSLLAVQVAGFLSTPLVGLAVTMNNPPGQHYLVLNLTDAEFSGTLIALVILLVSWVMDEARKLKENESLII